MKTILLLLFLSTGGLTGSAQGFIDHKPSRVKRDLDRHLAKTKVAARYEQTDSTLALQIRDPKFQPVDFIFRFQNNRCVEEVKIGCDSCVRKYLREALGTKVYRWTPVNDSTYTSRRLFHRVMMVKSNPSSLVVRKTDRRGQPGAAARATQ